MRIEAVLNSAKLLGWRSGENPAVWRGGLEAVLPRRSKVKTVRHHPAMPWQHVAAFMNELRKREGISPRALEFAILTAARSGEVRNAVWDEINVEDGLWIIPAEKMKAGREHRVPLSSQALALLDQMPKLAGCKWIFPGAQNRPMSDMSLSAVLRRMDLGKYTVHGFRSTFRDWAAEQTNHHPETVEMALAHTVANKVEAAYRRGDMLQKRRALMEDWALWMNSIR
jgi:integrase